LADSRPPDAQTWPDIAGRLVEGENGPEHIEAVRVYFEDTDAGGVAYHASFVRWCERGRTDFLRLLGTDQRGMIDGSDSNAPAAFVVRRMNMDFLTPARMDDLLVVRTRAVELGGASVTLNQTVWRETRKVFEADVTVVLVSMAGKPLRLSHAIRSALLTNDAQEH